MVVLLFLGKARKSNDIGVEMIFLIMNMDWLTAEHSDTIGKDQRVSVIIKSYQKMLPTE